jgi:WD40 repeat protein
LILPKHILLPFFVLLQLCSNAQLPQYHARLITDQQGLLNPDIVDLSKDNKGFLWLLSQSAVQCYDGRQSRLFLFDESVRKIYTDEKDRKWVLGSRHVYLFKNEYDGFQKIKIDKGSIISTISLFNTNAGLFLLLRDGIWVYDEERQTFIQNKTSAYHLSGILPVLFSKSGNVFYAASNDSIFKIDLQRKTRKAIAFKSVAFLFAMNDDELLVSDWNSRSYLISFVTNNKNEVLPDQIKNAPDNDFVRFFGATVSTGSRFFL